MEDLKALTERILLAINRDVTNILTKASGTSILQPEYQEALTRYYKLLTDARIAAKEQELEAKIVQAEEAIARGTSQKA